MILIDILAALILICFILYIPAFIWGIICIARAERKYNDKKDGDV